MTFRRTMLMVLMLVLSILLIYNSYIAPFFVRSYSQMGMGMGRGMHGRMWHPYYNTSSFVDYRIIILLALVIAGIFIYDILSPSYLVKKCKHCGQTLDNDRWKICPMCGNRINQRRGGNQ